MRGTEYGQRAPMPAPAPEPVEGREPDRYGVAVGDLVSGTDVTQGRNAVGVVIAVIPHEPLAGMSGNRYRIRCGDLYATGGIVERVIHDHPIVMAAAGTPIGCAYCPGEHASAERFIECQVAHVRADRERRAGAAA